MVAIITRFKGDSPLWARAESWGFHRSIGLTDNG